MVGGLSDISERLGLVRAGEFRTGNSIEPGRGFSGVRIGFPGFTYDSEEWHVAGVDNDVLQFGLRASDGVALAGAGKVILDADGVTIDAGSSGTGYLTFLDSDTPQAGTVTHFYATDSNVYGLYTIDYESIEVSSRKFHIETQYFYNTLNAANYYMRVWVEDTSDGSTWAETYFALDSYSASAVARYHANIWANDVERSGVGHPTSFAVGSHGNSYGQLYLEGNAANEGGYIRLRSDSGYSWTQYWEIMVYSEELLIRESGADPSWVTFHPESGGDLITFHKDVSVTDNIIFGTSPTPSVEVGATYWDVDEETLTTILSSSGVALQHGQETMVNVKNQTGATINDATPVRFAGTVGASGRILIDKMIADGTYLAGYAIGLTTESIDNGENGKVTWFGKVRGIDTSGTPYGETWNDGDLIYISPTTAGDLTNVRPTAPDQVISVGAVVNAHATTGTIFVRPVWYNALVDLDDVNISSPSDGDVLTYDSANSWWEAQAASGGGADILEVQVFT